MSGGILSRFGALCFAAMLAATLFAATPAAGGEKDDLLQLPFNVNVGVEKADSPKETVSTLKIIMFFTLLSLVPGLLLTMTAFTRIVIVLSFVRRALTVQQMPPNQTVVGLSLFLTVFVMAPVFGKINGEAIQPNLRGEITELEAIRRAEGPLHDFMLRQTRKKDLMLFVNLA